MFMYLLNALCSACPVHTRIIIKNAIKIDNAAGVWRVWRFGVGRWVGVTGALGHMRDLSVQSQGNELGIHVR